LIFECGITYISVNQDILKWMFRGDLDNFPQIQFMVTPLYDEPLMKTVEESEVNFYVYLSLLPLSFVSNAIFEIMGFFSYENQILLSRQIKSHTCSLFKYTTAYRNQCFYDNKSFYTETAEMVDLFKAVNHWCPNDLMFPDKKSVFDLLDRAGIVTLDLISSIPDQKSVFNQTCVAGFVTLTSKVIEKEDLKNEMPELTPDGMITYIDQLMNTKSINEEEVHRRIDRYVDR
jgi:hypothetical protein